MLCFSLIPSDVCHDFYRHILMFDAYIVLSSLVSGEWGVDSAIPHSEMVRNCPGVGFWAVLEICLPRVSIESTQPSSQAQPRQPQVGLDHVVGKGVYPSPHTFHQWPEGMPWGGVMEVLRPTLFESPFIKTTMVQCQQLELELGNH